MNGRRDTRRGGRVPLSDGVGVLVGGGVFLLALAAAHALRPALAGSYPLITFYPTTVLAAYLGRTCGLTATLLVVVLAPLGAIEPVGSFEVARSPDLLALAIFGVLGVVVTLISDRLHRARREAERVAAVRDDFLSIASHELRTPLSALVLQLELLEQHLEAGAVDHRAAAGRLEGALRQTHRLERLVGSLLDVSRLSQGRLDLRPEELDVGALVAEVVERHRAEAARAGCEVTLEVEGAVVGRWDRLRLEQIVTNLLANAIKYGHGGPVHLVVERADGGVRLRVRDQGIGIDEVDRERIFERFERAASPRHYGGLGLGLYIAREIVRAHGGRISVAGAPGRGSEFAVWLPADPPPAAALIAAAAVS